MAIVNDSEWNECRDPHMLLKCLDRRLRLGPPRKRRLLQCACCRRFSDRFDDLYHRALILMERHADKEVASSDLREITAQVRQRFMDKLQSPKERDLAACMACLAGPIRNLTQFLYDSRRVAVANSNTTPELLYQATRAEFAHQAGLVCEIFQSPFVSVRTERAWLSWNDRAIEKIALRTYEERDFDSLPVLADALEEAGCSETAILEHLRSPGPHVRGCWALDLILGKK